MSNTIFVTGATGFIGRHVVRRLASTGAEIFAVSRNGGEIDGLRVESVDLRVTESALRALKPTHCTAVVHLAAAIPTAYDGQTMRSSFESTVAIDSTVASLCRCWGTRLVYASTTSLYGSSGRRAPCREDQLPTPETAYADAKQIGEIVGAQLARDTGVPVTALRISAPYGPGQLHRTVVGIFLRAALESKPIMLHGSGARTQDFTFVEDVVSAVDAALAAERSGAFNIATGRSVSMRDLAETALAAVPSSGSRIEQSGKTDPEEHHRVSIDVSKARAELGWEARRNLLDGLRATAASLQVAV